MIGTMSIERRYWGDVTSTLRGITVGRRLIASTAIGLLVSSLLVPREGRGAPQPELPGQFTSPAVDGWQLGAAKMIAYEDHPQFTYVVAGVSSDTNTVGPEGRQGSGSLIRRFLLLKPSTIVVDDLIPHGDDRIRRVHVRHTFRSDGTDTETNTRLIRESPTYEMSVRVDAHVFRLSLPPADEGAGEIAIEGPGREVLLPRRPLTSGVLPFGLEGVRLLQRWDSAYQPGGNAPWDIGRPSGELVKAVEDGTLKPGRAVVLGCGTGTNAIYLAQHGFDVTGIDVAPTALRRAREKANKAGVNVRWLLADVTAPPELKPFDLVYDRGCYHAVRRGNAAGYVRSLRELTHPGSNVLILAGNANEERQYGPPRVKEEEIRNDFSRDFRFRWLRESHFDTATPGENGALAWSILLSRSPGD